MSHPYPHDALRASELRTRALLGQVDDSPQLGSYLRQLGMEGGHAKLSMPVEALRSAVAAYTRDLNSTTGSAGSYLIGTTNNPLEQLLAGTELGDLGVTIRSGLSGPATVPRATSLPTGAWLSSDGSTITEAQPTFGQVAVAPHYLANKTDCSRQLALQSEPGIADAVVGPLMVEGLSRTAFTALFSGSGTSGAPRGLLSTAGIGTVSGTSLGASGLRALLRAVLDAGAREANIKFVADPATHELLGSREFSTGSGLPCWHDGKILGRPAIATSLMPANTIVAADFSRATVWLFGPAVGLELDPYSGFASGLISYRLIVPMDFSYSPAGAFAVATSVN